MRKLDSTDLSAVTGGATLNPADLAAKLAATKARLLAERNSRPSDYFSYRNALGFKLYE